MAFADVIKGNKIKYLDTQQICGLISDIFDFAPRYRISSKQYIEVTKDKVMDYYGLMMSSTAINREITPVMFQFGPCGILKVCGSYTYTGFKLKIPNPVLKYENFNKPKISKKSNILPVDSTDYPSYCKETLDSKNSPISSSSS